MGWSTDRRRRFRVVSAGVAVCMIAGVAVAISPSGRDSGEGRGGAPAGRLNAAAGGPASATKALRKCISGARRRGCAAHLRNVGSCHSPAKRRFCKATLAFAKVPGRLRAGTRARLSRLLDELASSYHRHPHEHAHTSMSRLASKLREILHSEQAVHQLGATASMLGALARRNVMWTEPGLRGLPKPPITKVSARTIAAFPVLGKRQTPGEARQLAKLVKQMRKSSLFQRSFAASGVNVDLARREYSYPNGDAGYVLPGRNGNVCDVHLYRGNLAGAGCTRIGKRTKQNGMLGTMVVNGGYEAYGGLPAGTRRVRIIDGRHRTYEVAVNRWGGFDFVGKGVLMKLEAQMSDGHWKLYETGPFPPPPPPNEPKPPSKQKSSTSR